MEENKTKVWAVKEVRVEYYKAQPAENGDEYPYYATKITTYRVFVSNDITLDMPIAQKAIKEIIGNVTSETIKLTLDIRSIDDGDRFSKEMTQQATELLSAVLPQYHFEAAESGLGFAGLKYEIEAQNNVVAKRRKVVKYILVALFITAIIPYKHIPWASYVVSGIYSLFAVTIIFCLLTWLVARILKVGKIGVSMGVTPRVCLYDSLDICIHCGPIPLPDVAMSLALVQQNKKAWIVSTIPMVLLILIGFAFIHLRDYLFESSPENNLGILPFHTYSIAAIFAITCFVVSISAEIFNLDRWKRMYPQLSNLYGFFEAFLVIASVMGVCWNYEVISKFIGL